MTPAPCATLHHDGEDLRIIDLPLAAEGRLSALPHIHRILLENVLRTAGSDAAPARRAILDWIATGESTAEIPFLPARVLMHDTTCGPALVDIAAMRSKLAAVGKDPARLNPVLQVDVSTDHSLAVDHFARAGADIRNLQTEYSRNAERYVFMKWATRALDNFRVHPPGTGIMHTLNLEQLAQVVTRKDGWAFPDAMIGTDSHTPMANGIGILAWGVGGIEAESVFFGMPVMLRVPDVVGVRLTGRLSQGVTATDLALHITEVLRGVDLADKFVEFFGPGVATLSAGDRAVVANMTPEFGANSGYFPTDAAVLDYLRQTGRPPAQVALVEAYCKRQGLWFDPAETPRFTRVLDFDLSQVELSLAGPRRPQDRIPAGATAAATQAMRGAPPRAVPDGEVPDNAVPDGAVAIAAITSCTNTTDPRLLVAAGLVARRARALGLRPKPWVKTSFAPGSPAAARYLARAGLLDDLEAIGFGIVGFGCTTCIGNSGALPPETLAAQAAGKLQVAVLSGNRNFPGRVHPQLEAGFLASPPLVVAFAIAGDVERDILNDPLAEGVRLADLWPTGAEIDAALAMGQDPSDYADAFAKAGQNALWEELPAPEGDLYDWDPASTYLRPPPFADFAQGTGLAPFTARPLIVVGDDITTDHISPASHIPADSDAGRWLVARGEDPTNLNVYSSRRGNWEVMMRGLFTNRSVRNHLAGDLPAGWTALADGRRLPLWQAAAALRDEGTPSVIFAGERYGMGSSRDWAAKGAALLGVKAVIARSFERIHRSNLIGMGVLPLRLLDDQHPAQMQITPRSIIEIEVQDAHLAPRSRIAVTLVQDDGRRIPLATQAAIETTLEIDILRQGGVLPMILARAAQ